jgi:two-component system phosphate regulon sensor histidine kinase PhoR
VDALKNEKVVADTGKMNYFRDIIKEENKRMNKHVETILQAAALDRQEFQLQKQALHVHDLIKEIIVHHQLQLEEKSVVTQLGLNASNDVVHADPEHFRNLLSNLVDNAIKYSPGQLLLRIQTASNKRWLQIRVEDNGIGMSKETVKRIFEKFYRAHTGNLHNVKGFGLGLSYVKEIVAAHGGKIRVESTPGKGTAFLLDFPLHKATPA